jgi:hypothetical protein
MNIMNIIQLFFITLVKFITWIFEREDLATLELELNDLHEQIIARESRRAAASKWRTNNTQEMNLSFVPLYRIPGVQQTRFIAPRTQTRLDTTQKEHMKNRRSLWVLNERPYLMNKTHETIHRKLEAERKILRRIVVDVLVDFLCDGLRKVNISASE